MSVSSLLELLQITETQSEKMTALNTLVSQLEKVVAGTYTLNTAGGLAAYTLPYDDSSDLSDRTALRFIRLLLNDAASANFKVIHPPKEHLFFVFNDSSYIATFDAGGVTVEVKPNSGQILYCDGIDFHLLLSALSTVAADFHFQYTGSPGSSEIMGEILVARDTTILDNLSGAQCIVGTRGASTVVLDVLDNTTKFAEVSISSNVLFEPTFTTTVGTTRVISAGDRLRLRAPSTVVADFADVLLTIPATAVL